MKKFLPLALVLMLMPGLARATTCTWPSVSNNETWTPQQWNSVMNNICAAVNTITDSQISSAAAITQTKIAFNFAAAPFTTLPSFLGPGGAIELGDIDILNSGTNVSQHASRHAYNGQDPLPAGSITAAMFAPGAITNLASRTTYNNETALQASVGTSMSLRAKFDSGVLADNATVKAITACGSDSVYALVDVNSAVVADYVVKIVRSTMLKSGTDILLPVAADPVDMVCARDGSVYVLGNGTAGKVVYKISTAAIPVVTTLVDLGALLTADNLVKITSDPNTETLFAAGSITGKGQNSSLFKIPVSLPSTATKIEDADNDVNFKDLLVVAYQGLFDLAALWTEAVGTNETHIKLYSYSGALTQVQDLDPQVAGDGLSFEFDGSVFIVLRQNTAAFTGTFFDPQANKRMGGASDLLTWTGGTHTPAGTPQTSLFDGKDFVWQQGTAATKPAYLNFLRPPFYNATAKTEDVDMTGNESTPYPCGLASDGTFLYVCSGKGAAPSNHFTMTRYLQN